MKKAYAEAGIGNGTFLSTEYEEEGSEYRVSGFIRPERIDDVYVRVWLFKTVFIVSTKDGLQLRKKDRNGLKILFGIGGEAT